MKNILHPISDALARGESVALAVIVEALGSTPRKAGSVMAVFADGSTAGTVGGGALEHESEVMAKAMLTDGAAPSETKLFRLSNEEAGNIGMICGGDTTLHFCRVEPTDQNAAVFNTLTTAVNDGGGAWLALRIAENEPTALTAVSGLDETPRELHGLLGRTAIDDRTDSGIVTIPFASAGFVYVFGGGHVSQQIVPALTRVGFACVVYEDREEYSKPELFPDAVNIITDSFLKITDNIEFTRDDYVVIVTRGHRDDFNALMQTLPTPAKYVGCIGSRSKIKTTRDRLRENGISESDIVRLVNPIGLDIHSETPEEIAVSIAAQLILVRATA